MISILHRRRSFAAFPRRRRHTITNLLLETKLSLPWHDVLAVFLHLRSLTSSRRNIQPRPTPSRPLLESFSLKLHPSTSIPFIEIKPYIYIEERHLDALGATEASHVPNIHGQLAPHSECQPQRPETLESVWRSFTVTADRQRGISGCGRCSGFKTAPSAGA